MVFRAGIENEFSAAGRRSLEKGEVYSINASLNDLIAGRINDAFLSETVLLKA